MPSPPALLGAAGIAAVLGMFGCGGDPFMGLAAPDDRVGDAAFYDGDANVGSDNMSETFRDRSVDLGPGDQERDVMARDTSPGADAANEAPRPPDSSVDARGSDVGSNTVLPEGGDGSADVAMTDTGDARADAGGGAKDREDPSDGAPDSRNDAHADVNRDIIATDTRDVASDTVADNGTDAGVDVGADGTADVGAGADALVCGFAPPGIGGPCPAVCNDGCVDGLCRIACRGDQQCKGSTLECPAGFTCEINCSGKQSCDSASLICPELHACSLICAGEQSCKALQLNCRSGTCAIECMGNHQACDAAVVNCGPQTCSASCPGSESRPTLSCGQSCDCRPCP